MSSGAGGQIVSTSAPGCSAVSERRGSLASPSCSSARQLLANSFGYGAYANIRSRLRPVKAPNHETSGSMNVPQPAVRRLSYLVEGRFDLEQEAIGCGLAPLPGVVVGSVTCGVRSRR